AQPRSQCVSPLSCFLLQRCSWLLVQPLDTVSTRGVSSSLAKTAARTPLAAVALTTAPVTVPVAAPEVSIVGSLE
ncbi:hypothetical protein B0H19DRAFT_1369084, partial [Mycena capillaripes]